MDEVGEALKDVAYIVIGFAVLAVNRAQVRRHELAKQIGPQLEPVREQLGQQFDRVQDHLGSQARGAARSATALARGTEQQVRRAIRPPDAG